MNYRRYSLAAFVVGFALQWSAVAQESRVVPRSFFLNQPMSIMNVFEPEEFQRSLSEIDKGPDFRRVLLITKLKDVLGDGRPITMRNYSGDGDKFDLKKVGGRARAVIEHVLQQETENTNLSVDTRIRLWQAALTQRRAVTDKPVSELKEKYWLTIHSGIVGGLAKTSIESMERFLNDWFPYGKRITDMEEITGVRLIREGEDAVVPIDSGVGGSQYRFHLVNGVIESVIVEFIN